VTTVEQDTIYQYVDGWDLLGAALMERRQLLRELEQLAKAPEGFTNTALVAEFPVISAQALLYELSMIGEHIDILIGEINSYGERCGKPRVQVAETKRQ
jgi:hypothetical protein